MFLLSTICKYLPIKWKLMRLVVINVISFILFDSPSLQLAHSFTNFFFFLLFFVLANVCLSLCVGWRGKGEKMWTINMYTTQNGNKSGKLSFRSGTKGNSSPLITLVISCTHKEISCACVCFNNKKKSMRFFCVVSQKRKEDSQKRLFWTYCSVALPLLYFAYDFRICVCNGSKTMNLSGRFCC